MEATTLLPMDNSHLRRNFILCILICIFFPFISIFAQTKSNNDIQTSVDKYMRLRKEDSIDVDIIKSIIIKYQKNDKLSDTCLWWIDSLRIAGYKLKRPDLIAHSDIYTAQYYIRSADDARAFDYLYKALTQFRKLKDASGEANAFLQIGLIHYMQKQYNDAIENLSYSADIYKRVNRDSSLSTVYYLMGISYIHLKQWEKAEEMLNGALEKNLITNNNDRYFEYYVALTDLYTLQAKYDEASIIFKKIFSNWNDPDDKFGTCMVLIPYSRMLIGKGQLDSAYNTLQNALVIANEFSLINFKIDILHLLSQYYSKKGEFKEANSYLLKYYALRDSVFTADSHKTINMLKTKIGYDQQEDKLTFLTQKARVNKLQKIVLALCVFILLVISIGLYRRYSFKNRKEKELNKANAELNKALHNIRQAQNQLIQTEKMASLGRMSVGLAHELRNPLNFVINFAKLTSELTHEIENSNKKSETAELFKQTHKNLELIYQHSLRAEKIIFDMVKHTQFPNKNKTVDNLSKILNEFSNVALYSYKNHTPEFDCTIHLEGDPNLKEVKISPHEMMTIVMSIFNNAFDGMYQRMQIISGYRPILRITTKDIGHAAEVSIIDNGNGISDEIMDHIFEPFFTTKPLGKGTGLGLSMSYEIIRSHNGTITAKSIPGFQTEFILNIPYVS